MLASVHGQSVILEHSSAEGFQLRSPSQRYFHAFAIMLEKYHRILCSYMYHVLGRRCDDYIPHSFYEPITKHDSTDADFSENVNKPKAGANSILHLGF